MKPTYKSTIHTLVIILAILSLVPEYHVLAAEKGCKEFLDGSWKLIRDRLPEIYALENDPTEVRQITPEEMKGYLLRKLEEEVKEFNDNPSYEEMADIYEVLMALQREFGLSADDIEKIRLEKRKKKGGFDHGFIMKL